MTTASVWHALSTAEKAARRVYNTGAFRGWLCNRCNRALGYAGDNPVLLRRLADYLSTQGPAPTRPVIR